MWKVQSGAATKIKLEHGFSLACFECLSKKYHVIFYLLSKIFDKVFNKMLLNLERRKDEIRKIRERKIFLV